VVDGGGEAGFAELGGAHLLGGEVAALEELEDDGTLEESVVGEVHDTTAAGADLADELVLLDLASLHDSIIASVEGVDDERGRLKRSGEDENGTELRWRCELSSRIKMMIAAAKRRPGLMRMLEKSFLSLKHSLSG
jgi:hypothetical protein